jgi:hypothetical protein
MVTLVSWILESSTKNTICRPVVRVEGLFACTGVASVVIIKLISRRMITAFLISMLLYLLIKIAQDSPKSIPQEKN